MPESCQILGIVRERLGDMSLSTQPDRSRYLIWAEQDPEIQFNDYILAVALNPMYAPKLELVLGRFETQDRCLLS
ncbi:MAG: hypothetical protein HC924_03205 [Synechococcaceae cyanobacterium SM2_3_2]|nr:hypothetical protein [Synechococcaceae cyanobacterium SM2_3_2]